MRIFHALIGNSEFMVEHRLTLSESVPEAILRSVGARPRYLLAICVFPGSNRDHCVRGALDHV